MKDDKNQGLFTKNRKKKNKSSTEFLVFLLYFLLKLKLKK